MRWFRAQWSDYYAGRTAGEIAHDFRAEANRDGIPLRLVAFVNGELAGTIVLRERADRRLQGYRPGLGGLLVIEGHRGKGIGTALVKAGMEVARAQGYGAVFATTVAARGILERQGWQLILTKAHDQGPIMLFRAQLKNLASDFGGKG